MRLEVSRSLLDLLGRRRGQRLVAVRALVGRATDMEAALHASSRGGGPGAASSDDDPDPGLSATGEAAPNTESASSGEPRPAGRGAPAERRRASLALLDIWRDVARDLAVVSRGGRAGLRDPALLEELELAARRLQPGAPSTFVARLERTAELVGANANPELALDVLVLAWPHARAA